MVNSIIVETKIAELEESINECNKKRLWRNTLVFKV
jgi:hypothetical protein